MSNKKPLTDLELQQEIEKVMNGEFDDFSGDSNEGSGSDGEQDNCEIDDSDSDISSNKSFNIEDHVQVEEDHEDKDPNSDQAKSSSEDDEPLSKRCKSDKYIVFRKKNNLRGKNGHKWTCKPPTLSKRTSSRNIIHFVPGAKGAARDCVTIKEHFQLYFHDEIVDLIVKHTNEEIARQSLKYASSSVTISSVSKDELLAFFGVLIFSAAKKDNHLNVNLMFDPLISGAFYRSCMSAERFKFLVNNLRFDDKATREERKKNDSFAPIREVWDLLIDACRNLYIPSSYLTIDEQLLGFKGRCPFRMYIPNKPSKYGIKIVMLCDASSKYMVDASPYLGKSTETGGLPLANYYVKELTKYVHGSNRNITMDNWFTSIGLADEMLEDPYKLTIVGTLRKNKKEIPPELLECKGRTPGTSMFCFDKQKTLVSFMPKPKKIVVLLSTMHEGAAISQNGKPDIIINYNETKSGVDTFDQLCSNMSSSRKTRRWPQCVFYDMINIAAINAYVVYCHNLFRQDAKPLSRLEFMLKLGKELTEPWMRQRLSITNLRRNIRQDINSLLQIVPVTQNPQPVTNKRTICYYCPSRLRKMTTNFCEMCKRPICGEHRKLCCVDCVSV